MLTIKPFLMFEGRAEEAMNYYVTLFPNSKLLAISRYGANEVGKEGTVFQGLISLDGQEIMCIDSIVEHRFTFTPAMSFYLQFDDEAELERVYAELARIGQVLMPLDSYPFSRKFAWVADQFGVSWQLTIRE